MGVSFTFGRAGVKQILLGEQGELHDFDQTGYEGDYLNRGKWRKKDIKFMSHFSSVWCIWALEETS